MNKRFAEHFELLQREIFDISENIHKVKKKNHRTMSTIVEKLKYINNNKDATQTDDNTENNKNKCSNTNIANTDYTSVIKKIKKNVKLNNYLTTYNNMISQRLNEKINNYRKCQPVIQLYKNYKNNDNSIFYNDENLNSLNNKTYNNMKNYYINSNKQKFFKNDINNNISNNIKIEKNKNNLNDLYLKDYFDIGKENEKFTINYGNGAKNLYKNKIINKTIQTEANNKFNNKEDINFNNNNRNNYNFLNIHNKKKRKELYWNKESEKISPMNYSISNEDNSEEKKNGQNNNIFYKPNTKSMKNISKIKINSFKSQSGSRLKEIPFKETYSNNFIKNNNIINLNKINSSQRTLSYNKKPNNINRFNNNFNSIDIINKKNINNNDNIDYNKNILDKSDIKNLEKIKDILNCQYYGQCVQKIKEFSEQKKFIRKLFKLYSKYNNINLNGNDYENIILWINSLISEKQSKKKYNNKYEKFCKYLMKENNIKDFKVFQSYAQHIINDKKNENIFLNDIKKILSVENCVMTEKKLFKNTKRNKIKKVKIEENKKNFNKIPFNKMNNHNTNY